MPVLALAWRPAEANEGPLATGLRAEGASARVLLAGSLTEAVDLVQETAGVSPGVQDAAATAAAATAGAGTLAADAATAPKPGDAALQGPAAPAAA